MMPHDESIPGGRPAGNCRKKDLTRALPGGQTHGAGSVKNGFGKTSSPEPGDGCDGFTHSEHRFADEEKFSWRYTAHM